MGPAAATAGPIRASVRGPTLAAIVGSTSAAVLGPILFLFVFAGCALAEIRVTGALARALSPSPFSQLSHFNLMAKGEEDGQEGIENCSSSYGRSRARRSSLGKSG